MDCHRRFAVLAVLVAGICLGLLGCAAEPEAPRTITVVGTAEMDVPPDHLAIRVSVVSTDPDAATAKRKTDAKVVSILEFLGKIGVPAGDIGTGYVSLEEDIREGPEGEDIREGYEAETRLRAVVRDLDLYDRLLDGFLRLGLNRVWGVEFRSSEIIDRHREARLLAVRSARGKAAYLAAELGLKVGSALEVTEVRDKSSWRGRSASNTFVIGDVGAALAADAGTQSIAPESLRIREEVKVVFRLVGGE